MTTFAENVNAINYLIVYSVLNQFSSEFGDVASSSAGNRGSELFLLPSELMKNYYESEVISMILITAPLGKMSMGQFVLFEFHS